MKDNKDKKALTKAYAVAIMCMIVPVAAVITSAALTILSFAFGEILIGTAFCMVTLIGIAACIVQHSSLTYGGQYPSIHGKETGSYSLCNSQHCS